MKNPRSIQVHYQINSSILWNKGHLYLKDNKIFQRSQCTRIKVSQCAYAYLKVPVVLYFYLIN